MEENGRYISVQEAQDILRVSARQVQYHSANGKIQSVKQGRRLMLLESDVHALAEELGSSDKRPPQLPVEVMPDTGPLIDYIKELNSQLMVASRRIGELEAQIQQRLLPDDEYTLRQQLADAEARAKVYEEELTKLREQVQRENKHWWKRMFSN